VGYRYKLSREGSITPLFQWTSVSALRSASSLPE